MPATISKPGKSRKKPGDELIFVSDISHWFLRSLRVTGPFTICLCFKDGLVAELDFEKWIKVPKAGPLLKPLRDPAFFAQVYLDHGALTWPNSFDLDPCSVRHWAEQGFCD